MHGRSVGLVEAPMFVHVARWRRYVFCCSVVSPGLAPLCVCGRSVGLFGAMLVCVPVWCFGAGCVGRHVFDIFRAFVCSSDLLRVGCCFLTLLVLGDIHVSLFADLVFLQSVVRFYCCVLLRLCWRIYV